MQLTLRRALCFLLVSALPFGAHASDPFGLLGTGPGALDDNVATTPVQAATFCATCHGSDENFGPKTASDHLPFDTWAGTMMANSARDPLFLAALTVANQDVPGIGTFCLRCHTPAAFVRGHAAPDGSGLLDGVDKEGVSCDVCHRAADDKALDPGAPYIGNGQLVWETQNIKRGPYSDSQSPLHGTVQSSYTGSSELCGACHEVSNPTRNIVSELGQDLGVPFPLDTTYSEWKNSSFSGGGKGCIDCHLSRHDKDEPVCRLSGQPARPKPRTHVFAGGNLWGLDAVMAADPPYASAHAESFARVKAATQKLLEQSVTVEITSLAATAPAGGVVNLEARITNKAGHKFPTGYADSRRAFVTVSWTTSSPGGPETVVVGDYDTTTGDIQASPPTRVYEAIHAQRKTDGTLVHDRLALHNFIERDTRIPPEGFVATLATKPLGSINYSNGQGGYNHWDDASLSVPVPSALSGFNKLIVRVRYQSVTKSHVSALVSANTTDQRGTKLAQVYEATSEGPPITVAEASALVEVQNIVDAGADGSDGSSPDAGPTADAGPKPKPPADDGGCGCRAARDGGGSYAALGVWLGLALGLRRRRRGKTAKEHVFSERTGVRLPPARPRFSGRVSLSPSGEPS